MIRSVANRGLFVLTILTGSFLLFLVQPLVARMALPRLGGAPAVWNSAMLVYQALLLGGYAYAHALGRLSLRWQAGVHLGVLLFGAIWLPIGLLAVQPPVDASPVLWVPWLLLGSIGPLFFAVSAQAPLIQRWFGLASDGENPYALYAASNLGSFAGLIAYPLIVEPGLALHNQSWLWTGGYLLLIVLVALCAVRLPRVAAAIVRPTSPMPTLARTLHWTALALVPSGLMLATSTYITTDIVAMPLIWVLPLGLYLLSFSVAFAENRTPADLLTRIAPITVLLFGGVMMGGQNSWPWFNLIVALLLLFMASVALHTALYRIRPEPDRLTGFYLVMSVGGALGGVFAALIAPLVFDWTYEYPLLILAAGALVPQRYLLGVLRRVWTGQGRFIALACVAIAMGVLGMVRFSGSSAAIDAGQQGLLFLALAAIGLAAMGARDAYLIVLAGALILFGGYRSLKLSAEPGARTRSYFGVYTVRDFVNLRELDHGTTVHGIQLTGTPERERTPTTYYSRGSGVGQAMALAPALYGPGARMAVVGLGTGTLACYAQPGQSWRFYEIDPTVIGIARNSGRFTYLRRCAPQATIRLGDARLSLQAEAPGSLDLLALDAFSSDAVPMHLMTQEAFATYRRVLSARGVLIVHISNRFLDLEPVVAATARTGGWYAAKLNHAPSPLEEQASSSVWIALSRDRNVLATMASTDPGWAPLTPRPGFAPWTDDYSTILPLLK